MCSNCVLISDWKARQRVKGAVKLYSYFHQDAMVHRESMCSNFIYFHRPGLKDGQWVEVEFKLLYQSCRLVKQLKCGKFTSVVHALEADRNLNPWADKVEITNKPPFYLNAPPGGSLLNALGLVVLCNRVGRVAWGHRGVWWYPSATWNVEVCMRCCWSIHAATGSNKCQRNVLYELVIL